MLRAKGQRTGCEYLADLGAPRRSVGWKDRSPAGGVRGSRQRHDLANEKCEASR